jgi:DNA-3-methyladenine glycosylase
MNSRRAAALDRSFFARPTLVVARELLGCELCHRTGTEVHRGRIVEAEAYTNDAASHARHARKTPRNAVMFGPPGHAYIYVIYGMYLCLNAVTEEEGVPAAVLIRGLDGIDEAAGPARLCRALGITRAQNAVDLTTGDTLWIAPGRPASAERIIQTTRIGIRVATELPWRFYLAGSSGVSKSDRIAERATNMSGRRTKSPDLI